MAIHAESQQIGWVECNHGVGRGFDGDTSPPSVTVSINDIKRGFVLKNIYIYAYKPLILFYSILKLLPDLLKRINVLLYRYVQNCSFYLFIYFI